jgi:hypothetical protein
MMLPDGVHKRSEDWTVFFINREAFGKDQVTPDFSSIPFYFL